MQLCPYFSSLVWEGITCQMAANSSSHYRANLCSGITHTWVHSNNKNTEPHLCHIYLPFKRCHIYLPFNGCPHLQCKSNSKMKSQTPIKNTVLKSHCFGHAGGYREKGRTLLFSIEILFPFKICFSKATWILSLIIMLYSIYKELKEWENNNFCVIS